MDRLARELGQSLGCPAPDLAVPLLAAYADLVQTWNARTNLTGARDGPALCEVLFADALVLADPAFISHGARIVDVGSGVGAPILPLLLVRPDLDATLVEPQRRRVAFLRTCVGTLGLAGRSRVVESRVSEQDPRVAGSPFDVALSRATLSPDRWLAMAFALASRALVLTAAAQPPPTPEGTRLLESRRYRLPRTGAPREVTLYGSAPEV